MNENSDIELSVIIPVYNVEDYLRECIDSVISQSGLRLEIILIDDGSTDSSGVVADQYAGKDNRIKVIHQENKGLSAARNAGLDIAQGKYIAFVDSDDLLKEDSLCKLYPEAVRFQADMVMGKVEFGHKDGNMSYYMQVPKEMTYITHTGKEAFLLLMKTGSYRPMVWNYIYRRAFLEEIQARFMTGLTHEDELWTPVVLCQASKAVMVDTEYYYYRQRKESTIYSTNTKKRVNDNILVTNLLFEFCERYDFTGDDGELKNWMYVNILNRLQYIFSFLIKIKDTTYLMPSHQLDRYWKECQDMMPEPQKKCNFYYHLAEKKLKIYSDWQTSEWVASIKYQWESGKKMMLLYNTKTGFDLSLKPEDVPNDWVITTDRRYLRQADVVIFHLPNLQQELEDDLDKPDNQIWVGWYMEAEKNYTSLKEPEVRDLFEIWMSYREDADLIYPFYKQDYLNIFSRKILMKPQLNKTLMIFSNTLYEKSQLEYLEKIKKCIEFDSFYDDLDPIYQMQSNRNMGKMNRCQNYKFVIAFEDVSDTDYVTDKFYDLLLAGTVPIYLGAPNIEDFVPGDNCFVNVRQFENPQSLADFIKACYDDEQLYEKFFEWRNKPLRQLFLSKIEKQKEHPLVRLCRKVNEMGKSNSQ